MISFEIKMKPFGKERHRFGRGTVYTPKKTSSHEIMIGNLANTAMRGRQILKCACSVFIIVEEEVPKTWPKWKREAALDGFIAHTKKPDIDNIGKLILDSINGIVYKDDSQVRRLTVNKRFAECNKTTVDITGFVGQSPCNVKTEKEYQSLMET